MDESKPSGEGVVTRRAAPLVIAMGRPSGVMTDSPATDTAVFTGTQSFTSPGIQVDHPDTDTAEFYGDLSYPLPIWPIVGAVVLLVLLFGGD